jgi:hypothetical protein
MRRAVCLAAMLTLAPGMARAVELHIQFGALERMLTEQAFTQEGRRYVHGSRTTKCNFAYLEKPEVRGEGGRLRVTAKFTGRTAWNVAGQCVGVGDAFEVVITASPRYRNGAIGLQDVQVSSPNRSGYYVRKVCEAMKGSLAKGFTYPLSEAMQHALEDPGMLAGYKREVRKFTVPDIRVTDDALVLQVDFELIVK